MQRHEAEIVGRGACPPPWLAEKPKQGPGWDSKATPSNASSLGTGL